MSKKMWLSLLSVAVVAFTAGYGATANAWHGYWHGYFYGNTDTSGLDVWPPWGGRSGCQGNGNALPTWVSTASEFIDFTICKLGGSTQERRGAAFLISTMAGTPRYVSPGSAEINEFAARVNYAASRGWINFAGSVGCTLPNTYYQDSGSGDVAKYGGCGSGGGASVNFYNGSSWYIIKRYCANPVGAMPVLADNIDFNMTGDTTLNDSTVIPGQIINFGHSLTNSGPTGTGSTTIGWTTQSAASSAGPWSNVASGNAGTFSAGEFYVPPGSAETVTVPNNAVPNSQICRRIVWSPDTEAGGSQGSTPECATVQYNFTLTPSINAVVSSGGTPITGNMAEPGDTIRFTYAVNNTGTTVSQAVTCTYRQATHAGYSTAAPSTTFTPSGATCAPTQAFPSGTNTTIAVEASVPASSANTSICRSLVVSPASFGGGASPPAQSCVFVAAKPYFRAYGGDIMAGGGLATTPGVCSSTSNAAIISWNRRSASTPNYAGAGTQFAAYAMHRIYDVATSLNSGGAPTPAGLSFANTTKAVASGNFGGMWGSAPCIDDYYSRRPATTLSPPTGAGAITAMTTGIYGTGNVQFYGGGVISPGERITIYVDGNVHVNTNVIYAEPWTTGTVPSFQLIASGNIYVDLAVTRLDGLYVAQPRSDGTRGIIYTCASTIPAIFTLPALSGSLASTCDTKLTVNGAFVAKQVHLMRTIGTVRNSSAGETSGSGNIAEVFNYNPTLWMSQQDDSTGGAQYDAINSLPPVL